MLFANSLVFKSYAVDNVTVISDGNKYQDLIAEYWNWWINLPLEKSPEQGTTEQCTIHKSGSVILLLDPFQMGEIKQRCEITSGSSVLFPFYIGWCDNGIKEYYGEQSFQRILSCALDANRGVVTMKATLDNRTIIDIEVDNKLVQNQITKNNLPEGVHYKKITSDNFFNLTITNNTQFKLYEKPEDFKVSPYTYKGAADCFCGFIESKDLPPGNHQLTYKTTVKGSEGADDPKGWNFESDITYELIVTK